MSNESIQNMPCQTSEEILLEPPMPPENLTFDDGEPLESNRHRISINTLIRSIEQHFSDREDLFVGGNMFIYYSRTQVRNRDFRGPDYFIFDPFNSRSLQGWHLNENQEYQPLVSNERGWLWCQKLGLWLGTWSGTIIRETADWLRFYDSENNLVLLPEEAVKKQLRETQNKLEVVEQKAFKKGLFQIVKRVLITQFGEISPEIESRLQELDIDKLEKSVEIALTVKSLQELVNQIDPK